MSTTHTQPAIRRKPHAHNRITSQSHNLVIFELYYFVEIEIEEFFLAVLFFNIWLLFSLHSFGLIRLRASMCIANLIVFVCS